MWTGKFAGNPSSHNGTRPFIRTDASLAGVRPLERVSQPTPYLIFDGHADVDDRSVAFQELDRADVPASEAAPALVGAIIVIECGIDVGRTAGEGHPAAEIPGNVVLTPAVV